MVFRQRWTGLVEAVVPPGFMVDSGPDGGARSEGVTYRLEQGEDGATTLVLTADRAWLEDPARVWPVTIDPNVDAGSSEDTWVLEGHPGNHSGDPSLIAGKIYGFRAAAYLKFNVSWLVYNYVTAATLNSYNHWSAGGCTAYPIAAYRVTQSWSAPSMQTYPGAAYDPAPLHSFSAAKGGAAGCPAGWLQFDVTEAAQRWIQGIEPNHGLSLRVPPSHADNANASKQFTAGPTGQILHITYATDAATYDPGDTWVTGHEVWAHQDGKFPITIRNRGITTWPAGDAYRLGYRVYVPGTLTQLSVGTMRTPMPRQVSPQQLVTLHANVGRLAPGTYDIEWDMVRENHHWFSWQGVAPRRTRVTIHPIPPSFVSSAPLSGAVVNTRNPQLSVVADDPDDHPAAGIEYFFRICPGVEPPSTFPGPGAGCTQSGWQSSSTWTPSLSRWDRSAYWWGFIREAGSTQQWNFDTPSFLLLNPPQPDSARWGIGGPTANDGGVDLLTQNFVATVTDAAVGSAGPPLAITRTYNSRARERMGAFGAGWTSILDAAATYEASDLTILLTMPDGRQQRWGRTSEAGAGGAQVFRGPLGVGGTLTRDASTGNVTWTAGDGWRYLFGSGGGLDELVDPRGRSLELVRNGSGTVTSVRSVWPGAPSGATPRTLDITWSAGRVATVETDPVTPGGTDRLTWSYTYVSGQLTEVCDPRPVAEQGCVTYSYAPSVNGLLIGAADDEGTYLQLGYTTTGLPRIVQRMDGEGNQWFYSKANIACPDDEVTGCSRMTVTQPHDPADHAPGTPAPQPLVFDFDHLDRLVKRVDAYGNDARWDYDALGFLSREWDENDRPTAFWHDAEGKLIATATPRVAGSGEASWPTTRYRYDGGYAPGDPRYGRPSHVLDPRSSNIDQLTYATRFSYDAQGRVIARGTPPTSASPTGRKELTAYDPTTGLVAGRVDEAGRVTAYSHDPDTGDLVTVTAPGGRVTEMSYDGLGRPVSISESAPSDPVPRTTTLTYDEVGNVVRAEGPAVTNVVTDEDEAQLVTRSYDRARRLVRESVGVAPPGGGEPLEARTTTWSGHDGNGRPTVRVDGAGSDVERAETTAWTWRGMPRTVDGATGTRVRTRYTLTGRVHQTWAEDLRNPGIQTLLASTAYDPAGRVASEVDAVGAITDHTYWADDLLRRTTLRNYNPDGGTSGSARVLEELAYDAAGNVVERRTRGGDLVMTYTYTPANDLQTVNAGGRRQLIAYRADGQVQVLISTDDTEHTYTEIDYSPLPEAAPERIIESTGTDYLETVMERDEWGQVTATIDPGGRRVDVVYDRLGRPVRTISPTTTVEGYGVTPSAERPTTDVGYDVFGAATETRTPDGEVTTFSYDALGRPVEITYPSVERPDGGGGVSSATVTPKELFAYDDATRALSVESLPVGGTATEVVDYLGRTVTSTDALGGVASFAWDAAGRLTAATDPEGALRTYGYDTVGNLRTETAQERYGIPDWYTTTYDYDSRFDLVGVTSPEGGTVTRSYNVFGEVVGTTGPSAGLGSITTSITRDFLGRAVAVADGLGRRAETSYDWAGRVLAERNYQGSTLLRQVDYGYTPSGEVASVTKPGPNLGDGPVTTNFSHDGHGNVSGVSEPGGIATGYDYDALGRMVRSTDGNGNDTWFTYNAWGDIESVIDPATAVHPEIEDRRWVHSYEAPGRLARMDAPGGVEVTSTYDDLGQLVTENGTGGDGGPVSRALEWDLVGRLESVAGGGAVTTFDWDDRGNLLSAVGGAGAASFTWDGDGRMVSRTDAAGTSEFTYWPGGELRTASGGLTGISSEQYYDAAGQPIWTLFGDGSYRLRAWDGLGNPTSDILSGVGPYASQTWVWGPDGEHLASTTIGPGPHAGAGTENFTYDAAGRLIESQGPAGTVGTAWDNAGNRVAHGDQTAAYDQRNRPVSVSGPSGTLSLSWSERGTLEERVPSSGPATSFGFDAFDRLVEETTGSTSVAYGWDGLGRLAEADGQVHQYAGLERDPVAAAGELFERGVGGEVRGFQEPGGSARMVRGNHRGDLTTSYEPGTTGVASRAYTPFGEATEVGTEQPGPGFQGDWTSASGIVHMDARWYDPALGTFLSRDTINLGPGTAAYTNRYTYGAANPVTMTDPTGHWPCFSCLGKSAMQMVNPGVKKPNLKPPTACLLSPNGCEQSPPVYCLLDSSCSVDSSGLCLMSYPPKCGKPKPSQDLNHLRPASPTATKEKPCGKCGAANGSGRPPHPTAPHPAPWQPPAWSSPVPTHAPPPGPRRYSVAYQPPWPSASHHHRIDRF